jgi:hypothetical protein
MQLGSVSPLSEEKQPLDLAPDPGSFLWRAFTLDHSEEDAVAVFLRHYREPPRYCFENLGLLLVGPIPGQERIAC